MESQDNYTPEQYTALVIEAAADAGRILLENGAEIFRVEETMRRITAHFGVDHGDIYVLTNGIFTSGNRKIDQAYARVLNVPVKGAQLHRVVAVNQLSREIEQGKYTLDEVHQRLVEIENMPVHGSFSKLIACAVGCACFAIMFGGDLMDGLAALVTGAVMQLFLNVSGNHLSKLVSTILCAAIGTVLCILCSITGLGHSLSAMVIGAMMALIPGVAFTNGIRDMADGDYLSGIVRMMDALVVFAGIAIGLAAVFLVYQNMFGGALL